MTPWDSDWAGGTEGSDIRICKEYGISVNLINHAKEVASEVFPLERAVTPFSEYKLRLGISIMIEDGLQPKTADAVRKWVNDGRKLKVGGDVLVGLHQWETLVKKTPEVDKLLENMPDELEAGLNQTDELIVPKDLPSDFTNTEAHTALAYQQQGLDFVQKHRNGLDLSPLLVAPHVLHSKPGTLSAGTNFELLKSSACHDRVHVQFGGFSNTANGDIAMDFLYENMTTQVTSPDPNAAVVEKVAGQRRADPDNINEVSCAVPGELLSYVVKPGDILKAGDVLCTVESMKMEMKIPVPDELDGMEVTSLSCKQRTAEKQGDMLMPGDLLLEVTDGE